LLEKKNAVVMTEEWFDYKKIGVMFFSQLTCGPLVDCDSTNCIAQITLDNRDQSFSGDRAVVSDDYRRLSGGERSGENPHKDVSVRKKCRYDKQIP
jgi:hypothetical protein